MAWCKVRVAHHHHERSVSEQLTDASKVNAAHDKSARESVPEVMPMEVGNLGHWEWPVSLDAHRP